ncbi:MAG: hypothetical protein WA994_02190 [Ornithinimicrobium sp.]
MIDEPSAFNLLDRTGITAPRSIMFGVYTGTPSEDGLFLPPDWKRIREGLLDTGSTGPS